MSVALVWVHGETVKAQFMESVVQFKDAHPDVLTFGVPGAGIIARGRTRAVERFLRSERDWLWFVDADVVFAASVLPRLLVMGGGADVVAAAYFRSDSVSTWSDEDLQPVLPRGNEVTEIAYCGMGCTLIHSRVLRRLEENIEHDPWPWFGHDLVDDKRLGEDYTFCHRARLAGFRIVGVPELVGHFKLQSVRPPREWGVAVSPS